MKRLFTNRQRLILALISGNLCTFCRVKLQNDFHADHVKPFKKGGPTTLNNGQALCPKCNLTKGVN